MGVDPSARARVAPPVTAACSATLVAVARWASIVGSSASGLLRQPRMADVARRSALVLGRRAIAGDSTTRTRDAASACGPHRTDGHGVRAATTSRSIVGGSSCVAST